MAGFDVFGRLTKYLLAKKCKFFDFRNITAKKKSVCFERKTLVERKFKMAFSFLKAFFGFCHRPKIGAVCQKTTEKIIKMDNSTEAIHEFCSKDWNLDFNSIFHGGNILLGLGYLIPQDFELSILALRSMTMIGFGFMVIWSLETVCGFDLFLYNLLFLVINTIYTGLLIKRHFPVFIPEHQKELFKKVFEPMKISKKDFHLLMRDSTTQTGTQKLTCRVLMQYFLLNYCNSRKRRKSLS